jgi:hypothetical protein
MSMQIIPLKGRTEFRLIELPIVSFIAGNNNSSRFALRLVEII